ncbi:MAG: hypothetical protein ACLFQE_05740, partial [Thermotogota bacterium]
MVLKNRRVIDGQDEFYNKFLIAKTIFKKKFRHQEDIVSLMKDSYGIERNTTLSVLNAIANKNQYYHLREKYTDCFTSYEIYRQRYDDLKINSPTITTDLVSNFNSLKQKHFSYTLPKDFLVMTLAVLFNHNEDDMEFAYCYTYLNFSKNSYDLESAILDLYDYDPHSKFTYFSRHDQFNEFMSLFDLHTVAQIIDIHVSVLLCLLNIYAEDTIKHIKFKYHDFTKDVNHLLKSAYRQIDESSFDILIRRYGYGGMMKETLQSIGKDYYITRERVRQKAQSAENKLVSFLRRYRYNLKTCAESLLHSENSMHISFKKLSSFFNKYGIIFAIALEKLLPDIFDLDDKYNAVFVKDADKEQVVKQVLNRLPIVIRKSELILVAKETLDVNDMDFLTEIIKKHYQERQGLYKKRKIRTSTLILKIIDEKFPLGYQISNQNHLNYLRVIFEKRYPELKDENIEKRKVISALDNHDYRLVDKGTYVNPLYIPKINNSLIDEIKTYLRKEGIAYYKTIHESFKDKLRRLGIENHFQLKGAVDEYLEDEFYIKRDYISKREGTSVKQAIRNAFQTNDGIMDEEQLMKAINKNSLESLRISLYNIDDFFRLSNGRVVDKKTFDFTEKQKDVIIESIEALIDVNPVPCTTSNQVYVNLKFNKPKLLEGLKVVNNHKDLMKLIREYLSSKYYMGYKVISKQPDITTEK